MLSLKTSFALVLLFFLIMNPSTPVITIRTARLNIQQFYVLPTQCIYVFCVDLRTTAIISLYSINWLVFITETECVYCAVRTGSLYTASLTFSNSTFCPHSVFMCFVWIWEQTAIISLYSINWLVFITETECVYCAVRTGSSYIIQINVILWIVKEKGTSALESTDVRCYIS